MVSHSNRISKVKRALFQANFLPPHHQQFFLLVSLFLAFSLLFVEFYFSQLTKSLLLFSTGLVQLAMTVFILLFFLSTFFSPKKGNAKLFLATALINGFIILLFTGYIFIEIYSRFSDPIVIFPGQAFFAAVAGLIGNWILIRILLRTKLVNLRFGTFKLPFLGISVSFVAVAVSIAIIYCTRFYFLDTFLSLLFGLSIFLWAGFIILDAYWHISEVAQVESLQG